MTRASKWNSSPLLNLRSLAGSLADNIKRRARRIQDGLEPFADAAEEVSNTRALDAIARFGYAVTALLHLLIGVVAIRLAFGGSGEADTAGAIEALAQDVPGRLAVWAGFTGCLGLSLWQLSEATVRSRNLSNRSRLGKAFSSGALTIVYAVLALTFANFALGPGADSTRATPHFSTIALSYPFGTFLLSSVGVIVTAVGVYFVIKGVLRKFRPELSFIDSLGGALIDVLGIVGHVAKGIALMLVGVLFGVAAIQHNPERPTGLDASLKALLDHPAGQYVLGIIGFGFICHGAFGMIRAKYGRM